MGIVDGPRFTLPCSRLVGPLNRNEDRGKDWVAIILAIGIATALNAITFGVLYDAIFSSDSGISENATQILIASFGGIIGVLGGYIGYRAGTRNERSIDRSGRDEVQTGEESTPP